MRTFGTPRQGVEPELVIQFAKWPVAGQVKTRLMPLLGEQGALAAHIRLTNHVLSNLLATGRPVEFWWDRACPGPVPAAVPVLQVLDEHDIPQQTQQGADLGARMTAALSSGLERHDKVVIVGSDCPSVDAEYVRAAFQALEDHDLVLGPSDDGGYVLIGARRISPDMLAGITWGTCTVLEQTVQGLDRCGLSKRLLPLRWDVDEPQDWLRYQQLLATPEGAG